MSELDLLAVGKDSPTFPSRSDANSSFGKLHNLTIGEDDSTGGNDISKGVDGSLLPSLELDSLTVGKEDGRGSSGNNLNSWFGKLELLTVA